MDASALSIAARRLREQLAAAVGLAESQILIGHPALTMKDGPPDNSKHYLNLFFYRLEQGGWPADSGVDDPLYLRVHCLISAMSSEDGTGTSKVSAGENDLRLIGRVAEALHRHPVLLVGRVGDPPDAAVQVVPMPLSLDDINHIWATQGEAHFRLSLAYELALLPQPLADRPSAGPLVAELGLDVAASPVSLAMPLAGFGLPPSGPDVPLVRVDTTDPAWIPQLCLLVDDLPAYSLSIDSAAPPATIHVLCAGLPAAEVALTWELWQSQGGWTVVAANPPSITLGADAGVLDPNGSPAQLAAQTHPVSLPVGLTAQAALYASRRWQRPDGVSITVRSKPVLVNLKGRGS